MFLHIGSKDMVLDKEVIAIIDIQTDRDNLDDYLSRLLEKADKVVNVAEGREKSVIVTKDTVYLSPISTVTLKKRSNFLFSLQEKEEVLT